MRKIISLFICLAVLSTSAFASFVDMPENIEQKTALENAVKNQLLNGVGDNRIAPYESITRSQMGAILVRAMGATKKADITLFKDVDPNAWYYDELSSAVYMKAFQGDGRFMYPDKAITYQEAFLVLSRVFDLRYTDDKALDGYVDKDLVASWAYDGVLKIVSGGYYSGNNLNPNSPINRSEFAIIMDKLIKNYIDTPGTYTSLPDGNTLVRCDGVILENIKSREVPTVKASDLIIFGDSVKSASVQNADGVNIVIRGGHIRISGKFGIVKAVMSGTVITPDQSNISVKTYSDGTKGIIDADADGSYINFEQLIE